jgi:hypothetical protein
VTWVKVSEVSAPYALFDRVLDRPDCDAGDVARGRCPSGEPVTWPGQGCVMG